MEEKTEKLLEANIHKQNKLICKILIHMNTIHKTLVHNLLSSNYLTKQGQMRKKMNRPQQTAWAFMKSQRKAPNMPGQIQKSVGHGCGKVWSLSREGGGKQKEPGSWFQEGRTYV
jgi:hypothetical protein